MVRLEARMNVTNTTFLTWGSVFLVYEKRREKKGERHGNDAEALTTLEKEAKGLK